MGFAVVREIPSLGRIVYDQMQLPVRVGDRLFPPAIRVELPGDGHEPALTLNLAVLDGVPRCLSLTMAATDTGREVRGSDLREIRLEDWIEVFFGLVAYVPDPANNRAWMPDPTEAELRAAVRSIREARTASRRRVTPDLLQRAASVYRAHAKDRPTEAVALAFGVKHRTAAGYIEQARAAGMLPPTTRGRVTADEPKEGA